MPHPQSERQYESFYYEDEQCQTFYIEDDPFNGWEDQPRSSERQLQNIPMHKLEEMVDSIVHTTVHQTLKQPSSLPPFSPQGPNTYPIPPPTPILTPCSARNLPLPSIDTLLEYVELPFEIYDSIRFGEDRVVHGRPSLSRGSALPSPSSSSLTEGMREVMEEGMLCDHCDCGAEVNKFGFREFETIYESEEEAESEDGSELESVSGRSF